MTWEQAMKLASRLTLVDVVNDANSVGWLFESCVFDDTGVEYWEIFAVHISQGSLATSILSMGRENRFGDFNGEIVDRRS